MIDKETGEIFEDTTGMPANFDQKVYYRAPFLRTAYNYDMNEASDESGLHCRDKSLTIQSDYEGTDINQMLERFGQTQQMPVLDRIPLQSDFTEVGDFKTAMDTMLAAQAIFDSLPAKVRARFGNDPQAFLEFTSDPDNRDEMRKMGLLKEPEPEPQPTKVFVVDKDGKAPSKGDTEKGVT